MQKIPTTPAGSSLRLTAAVLAVVLLTPLLVHPSVPYLARTLQELTAVDDGQNFGYFAHVSAYLMVTLFVLIMLRPARTAARLRIVGLMILHGVATETAQYWIPARDCNPLDMACNVFAVVAAGSLYEGLGARSEAPRSGKGDRWERQDQLSQN